MKIPDTATDLFPGRSALAALGGASDAYLVSYRVGYEMAGREEEYDMWDDDDTLRKCLLAVGVLNVSILDDSEGCGVGEVVGRPAEQVSWSDIQAGFEAGRQAKKQADG